MERRHLSLVALALLPVLVLAGAATTLLLAVSHRYGYFGDELYFVAAGRHLDWGYADQPPLVPLIALVMDTVFPGSLVALRAPAALALGVGIVVAAMVARELGADRRAQLYTSAAFVLAFLVLFRNLNTVGFDILAWTVLTWLLVRWVRAHSEGEADDRLLLWSGVTVALGIQVKFQIVLFAVMLLLTLAIVGPREILRRPMLWVGAGIAAIVTAPTVVWQAVNGWPQVEMGSAVSAEMNYIGGPLMTVGLMLVTFGPVFGMVLAFYGGWRLFRGEDLRPFRFLGWTALGVIVVFALLNGRPYYIAGVMPALWAAGAVGFQRRRESAQGRRVWSWAALPALALSALVPLSGLPFAAPETLGGGSQRMIDFRLDEIGWPKLASDVSAIYDSLPPQERQDTVILTADYWSASAIEFYGDRHALRLTGLLVLRAAARFRHHGDPHRTDGSVAREVLHRNAEGRRGRQRHGHPEHVAGKSDLRRRHRRRRRLEPRVARVQAHRHGRLTAMSPRCGHRAAPGKTLTRPSITR